MRERSVAKRFDYDYPPKEVEEVGERAGVLADEAKEIHVTFSNNARDYAPKAARRLLHALGEDGD